MKYVEPDNKTFDKYWQSKFMSKYNYAVPHYNIAEDCWKDMACCGNCEKYPCSTCKTVTGKACEKWEIRK